MIIRLFSYTLVIFGLLQKGLIVFQLLCYSHQMCHFESQIAEVYYDNQDRSYWISH